MPEAKRPDNWPPRVRRVIDLVNGLLGLKPWYNNARPGGRFVKWQLPGERDWSDLDRVVKDLLEEHGVWEAGCVEIELEKNTYLHNAWVLRVTVYQDPQPRLLKKAREGEVE